MDSEHLNAKRNRNRLCYGEEALRKTVVIFLCKITPVASCFLRNIEYGSSLHTKDNLLITSKLIQLNGDEVHKSGQTWNPENVTEETQRM